MKKSVILTIAALLFYAFLRELTALKALFLCAGLALSYGLSRVPAKYISNARYPIIVLTFVSPFALFFYSGIVASYRLEGLILFLSFYGVLLYLATMETDNKGVTKEAIALSLLLFSCAANFCLAGKPLFLLSLLPGVACVLFISNRTRLLPIVGGVFSAVVIALFMKGSLLAGNPPVLSETERILVLGITFILFLLSYILLVKSANPLKGLVFLGFLALSLEVLLSVGLRVSSGLFSHSLTAMLFVIPLVGMTLKVADGGKA